MRVLGGYQGPARVVVRGAVLTTEVVLTSWEREGVPYWGGVLRPRIPSADGLIVHDADPRIELDGEDAFPFTATSHEEVNGLVRIAGKGPVPFGEGS